MLMCKIWEAARLIVASRWSVTTLIRHHVVETTSFGAISLAGNHRWQSIISSSEDHGPYFRRLFVLQLPTETTRTHAGAFPGSKTCSCISANELAKSNKCDSCSVSAGRQPCFLKCIYLTMTYLAETCFTITSSQLGLMEERSPVHRFPNRFCGALARILPSFPFCSLV